jgi:hypothetical protein
VAKVYSAKADNAWCFTSILPIDTILPFTFESKVTKWGAVRMSVMVPWELQILYGD